MEKISRERLALGSYHYMRYPFSYFLDSAVRLGIHNIELWAAAPHFCLDIITPAKLAAVASELKVREIKLRCITPEQCQYPVNLASEDSDLRDFSIAGFKMAILSAEALACPQVLVTAGCGYFNGNKQEAWELAKDSISQLSLYAKEHGVSLVLETLTPLSSNILNSPTDQKQMIRDVEKQTGIKNITPMLDCGQMWYMNQNLSEFWEIHGDNISRVHLHSSGPAVHMALGDGQFHPEAWIRSLEEKGYRGEYSFEFNDPRYRMNPEEADRKSLAWLTERGLLEA